ncbi:transcriptional regulator-domain-containing protein [Sordaria brevicollis]|uniref:Transcriptional regulator-domain-containing protein n=1 Tax=Sordaria brevicollis TaxID=83679 RepID=A0AAE0PGB9_SORBR|nr:transcriptional regulator-domain-containing protein [Sordaria brevicollis]
MASLARSIIIGPLSRSSSKSATPWSSSICAQCRRTFITSPALQSGHNKWSKIRHQKAAHDAKTSSARTYYAKNIILYSKLYGPSLADNPQLANFVQAAKKAGVPKAVIEGAIAKGQGKSSEGAVLEPVVYEAIIPPNIALVVDAATENTKRVIEDLNGYVKKAKGAKSPSKFLFERRGRVVFEKSESGLDVDDIMEDAIEFGAEDLENDEEGNIIVWSDPSSTQQISKGLGSKFNLKILESEIIWHPIEDTRAPLDSSEDLNRFIECLESIKDYPDVQAIWSNVTRGNMSDEEWARVTDLIDE